MNKLEYLLSCLSEEAGEVIQEVGKAHRFGLHDGIRGELNEDKLIKEFIDTYAVISLLQEEGYLKHFILHGEHYLAKKEKVRKWMKYSVEKGCLDEL